MVAVCEIIVKSYFVFISYTETYIFRSPKYCLVLKMAKITRKMQRNWDHWATVEDLSKRFEISKRRVQQIIASNIDVIEKAVLVKHVYFGSGVCELMSIPIYRRVGK